MWNIVAIVSDLADNSCFQNHTRFQTKSIPVFRPERRKKPTLWGGTYPYGLYKEVPPPPPGQILSLESVSYFGKSEHFSGKKKKNLKDQNLYRETGIVS